MQEISLITSRLEKIGIPYCIVGGITQEGMASGS